ncbi:MAG: alpha-2-macroglobulin family protein [Cyanobacteriota/Melainabacteria group bacterium]
MRKVLSLTARTRLFLVLGIFILTAFLTHTGNIGNASENNADSSKDKKPKNIEFTLKEAKVTGSGADEGAGQTEPVETPEPAPKAKIENITADRLKQLLSLLSPIEQVKEKAFVLPEQSLVKPKLPGNIVKEKFPPEPTNEKRPEVDVKSEPLQVVRISHTGPVDTAGQFTVTFSHPMVPIGEAKHESNPEKYIIMKPMPKGTWRWLDTRTILFEPEGKRFPRATVFKVAVPEGIKSVNGNVLKKTRSWELTTSAPSVKTIYPSPHSFQDVNPLIVAIFNQKIDRNSVLEHLTVKSGNSNFAVKQVDKSLAIKNYGLDKLPEDEWIALRATNPFPRNSQVILNFGQGYQSKEGPLLSAANQSFAFRIYGPLKLASSPKDGVSPDDWNSRNLNFNNSLDANAFQESMVTIKPEIPNQKIRCYGARIYLEQPLEPVTTYKITFSSNLKDIYGQTLGKNVTISFTTGVYNTQLQFDKDFITLPGSQKPQCLVRVKGSDKLDVTIFRAKAESAMEFLKNNLSHGWVRNNGSWFDENSYEVAGKKTIKLEPKTKDLLVDLKPYLKNNYGQFVIATSVQDKRNNQRYRAAAWVQVTDLSVDAFKGKDLYTFVSALDSGKPLAKVDVTLLPHGDKGATDKDGMIKLPITGSWHDSRMLVATRGSDQAILPSNYRAWSGWSFSPLRPQNKWYGVTDRNLYKPGESVKVKGWTRKLSYIQNESEKIELAKPDFSELLYRVMGYDGQEISHGEIPVDQSGGFDFEFKIPDKINLGQGYINLGLKADNKGYLANTKTNATERPVSFNAAHTIQFAIQEFRRPEFEMKVSSSKGTSMLFGETTRLTSKAKYFAGGSLKGSPVSWQVRASESTYSPPGWQGFRFGTSTNYWGGCCPMPMPGGNYITKNLQATADGNGETAVEVKLDLLPKPAPVSCVCEATIQDVNRQSWSDKVNILVHPADTYVGVKSRRWFYRVTDPIELEFIAVDLDGKAKDGQKIAVELVRKERTKDNKENDVSVEKRDLTSTNLPLKSNFKVDKGGNYELITTVTDKAGRKNETRVSLMIQDDKTASTKDLVSDKLVLIADKEEYQPGDTMELMVSSPFYPAHGLMTIRRHSIVETRPIEVKSASATFKIPVKADFYPNFAVEVYLAGDDYHFGSETVTAKVPPKERQLSLTAVGADKLTMPGTETTISIDLKDAQGKPVQGGQVAIAVADESVLALSGYKWSDPINAFYPQSSPHIDNTLIRTSVILTEKERKKDLSEAPQEEQEADDLAALPKSSGLVPPPPGAPSRGGGAAGFAQSMASAPRDMNMFQVEPTVVDERHYSSGRSERQKQMPQVNIRTNFNALAYFKPSIYTDVNGHAQIKFKLPDSLTRYRVMAIAVAGDNLFGSSESNITAQMPLMIKPSAPRFLNFGDRCELPVVLQNQTDEDIAADVILRAANAAVTNEWQELPSGKALPGDKMEGEGRSFSHAAGKHLVIPANNKSRSEDFSKHRRRGKANFQCAVVAENSPTQASSACLFMCLRQSNLCYLWTGGQGAIAQKLDIPKSSNFTQIGGLTISSSSTAVQALTDAYFQIRDYQFGCSEQLSSRIIAMVSLHDVLSAFGKMDALAQSQYRNKIQQDLDELVNRQNGDGSFGLWTKDEGRQQRYPYMSIQVARALSLARENDYKVADDKLELSRRYLKNIRQHIPADYPDRLKRSIKQEPSMFVI